ncbi:MAG: hypothetical protein NC311_19315 [Muribaculaceae bacterium]|nr:hypothetical protein [Muribaculaceae bacterium]
MEQKKQRRYRPSGNQTYIVERHFVGARPVPEAMRPLILAELRRIQTGAAQAVSGSGDSVAMEEQRG